MSEKNYDLYFYQTHCGMRSVRSGDLSNKHASEAFDSTSRKCKSIFQLKYQCCQSGELIS